MLKAVGYGAHAAMQQVATQGAVTVLGDDGEPLLFGGLCGLLFFTIASLSYVCELRPPPACEPAWRRSLGEVL